MPYGKRKPRMTKQDSPPKKAPPGTPEAEEEARKEGKAGYGSSVYGRKSSGYGR